MFTVKRLAGAGIAAGALLLSTASWAQVTFLDGAAGALVVPIYATQAVTAAANVVTFPGPPTIPTPVFLIPAADITACAAGSSVTIEFTLPGSATFASNPGVTADGVVFSNTGIVVSGGAPSGIIDFTVPMLMAGCATATNATLTLNAFTVNGAAALATSTLISPITIALSGPTTGSAAFNMKGQVVAATGVTFNPAFLVAGGLGSSATTGLANSNNALAPIGSAGPTNPLFTSLGIDTTSTATPALVGTQFQEPVGTTPDTTLADLGSAAIALGLGSCGGTTCQTNGTSAFSFGAAPATITLAGNFSGIASAYLTKGSTSGLNSCPGTSPPSTALVGTVAPGLLTFTGDPFGTGVQEICLVAKGTAGAIIGANVPAATAFATALKVAVAGSVQVSGVGLLGYGYTGGTPVELSYQTQNVNYPTYLRIVNLNAAAVAAVAILQGDTGSLAAVVVPFSNGTTSLPANNNDTISAASILSAAGPGFITGPFTRFSMILVPTLQNVFVSSLLGNPGGVYSFLPGGGASGPATAGGIVGN